MCRCHCHWWVPRRKATHLVWPALLHQTCSQLLFMSSQQIWQVGNSYVRSQRFLECVRLAVDAVSALSLRVFGCIPVGVQSSLPCHWMRFALVFVSVLAFPCLLSCLLVGFFTVCVCLPRAHLGMLHPPSHRLVLGRVPSCLPPSLSPVLRAAYLRLSPF